MRIHEILHAKGYDVITIQPRASVMEMLKLLRDHNLGAVIVSEDGRRISGIVTERDVVRRLVDGADFLSAPVSDVMTTDVQTCQPADSVHALMTTMTNRRIRHLPVVDEDGLLEGIVSIGDVVKSHITQIEFERDQLEGYLTR
jgi:CBS domain-containing protein